MHLPSGILDGHVEAATAVVAAGGLGFAVRHALTAPDPRCTPQRLATVAAAVFAGQLLNVPVASGTSGHLLGITAAVALLGWSGGVLAVSAVLAVQALVFADGGVTSLGANTLNMALAPSLVAAVLLGRLDADRTGWSIPDVARLVAAAGASVAVAVAAFSVEYALSSGRGGAGAVASAMGITHLPMAGLEALATVALVGAGVAALRRPTVVAGLLAIAAVAAPWASSAPDGLERVLIDRRLTSFAAAPTWLPPTADYHVGGGATGVVVAGALGLVAVAAAAGLLGVGLGRSAATTRG